MFIESVYKQYNYSPQKMRSMSCCGRKQPNTKISMQQSRRQLEVVNGKKWRFADDELFEFTKRFQQYAVNQKISHKNYRESLGIIGIESLSFMCDRMFNIMDKDKDGYITLAEYLNYIDVLLYGTEEEKLKQSFELLDEEGIGTINFNQFRRIVSSFAQMWSAALGQPTPINPRFIEKIFKSLANGKDSFDLNDFVREMKANPDMLFWFSKPERAMNKRMNEHLGQQEQRQKVMSERIEALSEKFNNYQSELQGKLQDVIDIITGVATPEKQGGKTPFGESAPQSAINNMFIHQREGRASILSNKEKYHSNPGAQSNSGAGVMILNTDDSNRKNRKISAIRQEGGVPYIGTSIKKAKNHRTATRPSGNGNNNLFMNLGQIELGKIEFPNNVFENLNLSPKLATQNGGRQIGKRFQHASTTLGVRKLNSRAGGSFFPNMIKSQPVEVIVEEKPKVAIQNCFTDELEIKNRHIGVGSLDQLRFEQGERSVKHIKRHQNSALSVGQAQIAQNMPNHRQNNYIMEEDQHQSPNVGRFQISGDNKNANADQAIAARKRKQNRVRIREDREDSLEDDEESKLFDRDIDEDYAVEFEGGEKEINHQKPQLKIPEEQDDPIQARGDSSINENDINLDLSNNMIPINLRPNLAHGGNHTAPNLTREITFQRNPMYPGQIFFVESPTQLSLIDKKQQQILEEDDNYDSYLSESAIEDESLVKKDPRLADEVSDNEIDVDKLDFEDRALYARLNALKLILPKYQQQQKDSIKRSVTSPTEEKTGTVAVEQLSPEPQRIQNSQPKKGITAPGKLMQIRTAQTLGTIAQGSGVLQQERSLKSALSKKPIQATIGCQTDVPAVIEGPQIHFSSPDQLVQPNLLYGESVLTFAERRNSGIEQNANTKQRTKPFFNILANNFQAEQYSPEDQDESIKKRFSALTQNEKYLRRINLGKEMILNILTYMIESQEMFDTLFKQLLSFDQQENEGDKNRQDIQVQQNVPRMDKKNKLFKARPRSQVLDSAKLIHPAHENFNLVCNIMMGIKKAIDSALDIPLLEITEKEFNIRCKYEMAPYRTNSKDNIKACTFYDYAPQVFASIRKTFGIRKDTYSNSLGPDNILGYMFNANFQPLAELCSSGKSGSFFYYTSDGKFVLKTISRAEFKFLKKMLKDYHNYLTYENQESIISKIFGLHKIIFYRKKTAKFHKKVYFTIMNNVFHTYMKIDRRYDLKGSTQGRLTIEKDGDEVDPTMALKDLDFIASKEKFRIEGDTKKRLLETIKKDTKFFARMEIIDYSLLVGVHVKILHPPPQTNNSVYLNSEASEYNSPIPSAGQHFMSSYDRYSNTSLLAPAQVPLNELCEKGIQSIEKSCVYFIGIIDTLTEYSTKKKFEHVFKSIKYDNRTISCVPPQQYADRFVKFMTQDAFQ